MNKIYYTQKDIQARVQTIIRDMSIDNWKPDYIVGLTRGGLIPATMISHYTKIPMYTLHVSLRDNEEQGPESNLWMPEDAFGYYAGGTDIERRKNILIVDDINDSGATLNWIINDWTKSCLPIMTEVWNNIWGNNVRFAVLVNNESSDFKNISYAGSYLNKLEDPVWIVFPWENWWSNINE